MQEILRGGRLMVAVATAVQDQSGGMRSNTVNGIALSSGLHNVTGLQLNEQFSCGNDYAPKVRKPYTITKQRERWTDEEHKKFIEALKLYGRAWRRIEEHVGTKTAVQIRSHAQKFFSKVVRESSGNNINSVEPIEIPPPRPKRKPMHPYPRKSVNPLTKETSVPEQTRTSSSPNLSVSELENQSPTSVLSAVASDALGSTDSDTPNGSLSPVSSAAYVNRGGFTLSEPYPLPEENGSTSAVLGAAGSVADEKQSTNLELFSQDNIFAGEEEATTRSLKLFGRTVLVTDSSKPSSPTVLDMNRGKPVQPLARKVVGTEALSGNSEFTWCHSPSEAPGAPYLMQHKNRKSNPSEAGSGAPLSCWTFYGGVQLPVVSFCKSEPAYSHLHPNMCGVLELQKEGSWTGSNSGSANDAGDAEKNADVESQSCQFPFDKEEKQLHRVLEFRPSERSAFSELRASPEKHTRGFVPYKKRRIAEEDTLSSAITGKDGVDEEVCLCL